MAVKSIYEAFGNTNLETDGIWLNYGAGPQGPIRIKIARAGGANKRYASALEQNFREHRRQYELGTLDNDVATAMLVRTFADAIVLDWEGVTDRNGELLPLTKENVVQVFTDLPDLFVDVRESAARAANFKALDIEADVKNL